MTFHMMKQWVLAMGLLAVSTGVAVADESVTKEKGAAASYAQEAACINYLGDFKKKFPEAASAAIAMLGRVPPCEVKKVVEAWYDAKYWRRQ